MAKGKMLNPDACAGPGKAKRQGGISGGKKATLNNSHLETSMPKCKGTPKDKGVNR